MKYFTLLLFFSVTLISCKSDDDANAGNPELNGVWSLTQVVCECPFINLELGQHTWDINLENNTVVIQNNVTEDLHTLRDSGTYSFSVTDSTFTIFDIEFDYFFSDGDLILEDEPELDGPRITFKRS